jgi:hypothetical protein
MSPPVPEQESATSVVFTFVVVLLPLYLAFAYAVWSFRNPKANEYTFITHFVDVIAFRKLPTFQETSP